MSALNLNKINNDNFEKNSGVMEKLLILYINDGISADFEDIMKKGYEEMAEINLEYSKIGFEYMLDDVNEYEAWICGVWLFKWQILW